MQIEELKQKLDALSEEHLRQVATFISFARAAAAASGLTDSFMAAGQLCREGKGIKAMVSEFASRSRPKLAGCSV
jgi:hypothetical protein